MYINPFLAGVIATVFVEVMVVIVWAFWDIRKGGDFIAKDNTDREGDKEP